MQTPTPDRLELALARIFQLCDANLAALLKAREDQKLSRRRYWWQDEQETETQNTLI
jgi:hypothetical protein